MSESNDAHTAWAEAIRARANASTVPSGILDLSPLPPHRVDGRRGIQSVTREQWSEIYYRLRNGALPGAMPRSSDDVEAIARSHHRNGTVPIAIGRYRYHQLRETGQSIDQAHERSAFFAAALEAVSYRLVFPLPAEHHGLSVRYSVPAELYLSNQDERPSSIEIDFDDGKGLRSVTFDEVIAIDYHTPGTKRLRVRAAYAGSVEDALFELPVVQATTQPTQPPVAWTLTSPLSSAATGIAYVFFANGKSLGNSVMLLAEGFPGGYTYQQIWSSLDIKPAATSNLAQQLLDAGTDVIFVTYDDGTRAVEDNAGVVIDCIQQAISASPSAKLFVGGESMGGLTTRYALAYMETHEIAHNTAVYYSIDTPHDGASVPLSVQCALDILSTVASSALAKVMALLQSTAAQEMMLITCPNAHTALMPSPDRSSFLANLAAVGDFPTTPKLVGVSNGTSNGQQNSLAPGSLALSYSILLVNSSLYAAPGNATGAVVAADGVTVASFPSGNPLVGHPAFDSAPGGTLNVFGIMAQQLEAANIDVTFQTNAPAAFIPAISATAMEGLSCYSATALTTPLASGTSRLNAWLADTTDEQHVTVTQPIATFLEEQFGINVQRPATTHPTRRTALHGSTPPAGAR